MAKKYKVSGKRSGPPPLRGPNPNVPPIKMRFGGGADMGDPGRAQERADRGYGSVGPADDRGSQQQNANQRVQVKEGNVRPTPLGTALTGAKLLGNIATFGASKVLDIPLGAMRLAKNIVEPVTNKVSNTFNNLSTTTKTTAPTFTQLEGDRGLCPDGSNPPCSVVQASDGKSIRVRGTKAAIRGTGFKGVF